MRICLSTWMRFEHIWGRRQIKNPRKKRDEWEREREREREWEREREREQRDFINKFIFCNRNRYAQLFIFSMASTYFGNYINDLTSPLFALTSFFFSNLSLSSRSLSLYIYIYIKREREREREREERERWERLTPEIQWFILKKSNTPKCFDSRCNLCLEKEMQIMIYLDPEKLLNQRCELIARCKTLE